MTPDDMERTMQFIVEQQAHFAGDIAWLKEQFIEERKASREMFETLVNHQYEMMAGIRELTATVAQLADSQAQLADRQAQLADRQAQLADSQAQLVESQGHTDARLNALIDIVDKLVRGPNGGQR
jgi:uncharacterized protein YciW